MSGEETDWSYTPLPTLSKKETPKIERPSFRRVAAAFKACPIFDTHFLSDLSPSPRHSFGFDCVVAHSEGSFDSL